jgi:fructokinase
VIELDESGTQLCGMRAPYHSWNMTASTRLGAVEGGGTKFRAAVVDAVSLGVLDELRVPTTTPAETVGQLISFFEGHDPVERVGVAMFGPVIVDPDRADHGACGPTPKPGWTGANVKAAVGGGGGGGGAIRSDVEAAVVAEATLGAGRGHRGVAYVTIGTGVGGAVAVDGELFRGRDHTEIGHIPVRRSPGDDYPGRCPFHGDCLEGMASGPALQERWSRDPQTLGDRPEVWSLEAGYLAQLVRVLVYTFVPDVVVLGGGIGTRPGFATQVQAAVTKDLGGYSMSHADDDRLVVTTALDNDAGLIGAALLAAS